MDSKKIKIIISILCYLYLIISSSLLIYWHKNDLTQTNNWSIFYVWTLNLCMALVIIFDQLPKSFFSKIKLVFQEDKYFIFIILALAILTRFFLLASYPYISFGDELRDPGFNALKISQGVIKDFFGFGSYQGYGNFIPLISYFFMLLFKTSILIYRIPAAFVGVLAVFFTYLITRFWTNRLIAFTAALFLALSVKHLHYSRTELLIIIESLLTLIIISAAYLTVKSWKGFFLLGIAIGIIFHFYASTRGVAVITLFYIYLFYGIRIIQTLFNERGVLFKNLKELLLGSLLLIIGFVTALGPTLNNLSINNIYSQVGTTHPIIQDIQFKEMGFDNKIKFLASSYRTAFYVYTFESSEDFHLQFYQPMLSFPLNWFFIAGIIVMILKINRNFFFPGLLLFIVFLNPISNQVIINLPKHDHRLIGITPILNIIAAYGLITIVNQSINSYKIKRVILMFICITFSLYQIIFYFIQRPSDYSFKPVDYMFYYIAQYIKRDTNHSKFYILQDSNYDFLLPHFKESFEFLDYPKSVQVIDKSTFLTMINENETKNGFISIQNLPELNSYKKSIVVYNCEGETLIPRYSCPIKFKGRYSFYVIEKFNNL